MVVPGNSFSAALGDLLGASPALTLVLGLVHVVAGYRCWVGLLGIYGLVFTATIGGAFAERWFPGQDLAYRLMQVGAGLFGFGAVLAFHRVGVFILGALAGAWQVKRSGIVPRLTVASGFVIDQSYGIVTVSKWQAGQPQKSIWTGLKQFKDRQHEIVTWRCGGCGTSASAAASAGRRSTSAR